MSRRIRILLAIGLLGLASRSFARGVPELSADVGALPDDERKAIDAAFVEEEPFLGATAWVPRSSAEAHRRMKEVVAAYPRSVAALAYSAEAAEAAGEFAAAEGAWKQALLLSGSAPWVLSRLASHYQRRLQPDKAVKMLDAVAEIYERRLPAEPGLRDALRDTYTRALALVETHALSIDRKQYRRALVELHPEDLWYLRSWLDEMAKTASASEVRAEAARLEAKFPDEDRWFVRAEAAVLVRDGEVDRALALYRKFLADDTTAYDLAERWSDYHALLRQSGRLYDEKQALEARARGGAIPPADFAALFWLRYFDNRVDSARALLDDARASRPPTTEAEALLRGRLHLRVGDVAQAIRYFYGAYAAAKREDPLVELGLALLHDEAPRTGLTPLDPLDAFALDRLATGPSIPGGLASLVFQGTPQGFDPELQRVMTAYLNGLRAERVLAEAEEKWPKSKRVAALAASIVTYYRAYERHAAVVAVSQRYLERWPDGDAATEVALAGAHALRRSGDVAGSDRAYLAALERAEKRSHAHGHRVFDTYARVLLDERRPLDVVKLHWERVERSPRDPERYERMLQFLTSVRLYDEELKVYQKAAERFRHSSWHHRIARWHLQHKGENAFRELTEKLMQTFSGSEAEHYLAALVYDDYSQTASDRSRYYEAVYKMALDRFPYRMTLVTALLAHYDRSGKRSKDADALVARYAPYSTSMMRRLLETTGAGRRFDSTLKSLEKPRGRGEKLLKAELYLWLSRHEKAMPLFVELTSEWPEDADLASRAANLIAGTAPAGDGAAALAAVVHLDRMTRFYPTETSFADRAGSLLAEAGELAEAQKRWEHFLVARKGDDRAYVQLAGALWDYYLFDEAEAAFTRARKRTGDPLLFWDKMGGVHESRRAWDRAAAEYAAALADEVARDAGVGFSIPEPVSDPEPTWSEEGEYYEGDYHEPVVYAHGADTTPAAKLYELMGRRDGSRVIDDAFAALERARPKDYRPTLAKARWLVLAGRSDEARRELLAAVPRFKDDAFLRAVGQDAVSRRWNDLAVLALERRADLGGAGAELVFPLVDAMESAGEHDRAEARYRVLIAKLDKGGDRTAADAVTARARFADYLERRGKLEAAFAERRAAADRAPTATQNELLLDLAWRLLEAKRNGEADAIFVELRRRNPRDLRPLEGLSESIARTSRDPAALRAHYDKAIADAKALPGQSTDERNQLVAQIRRAYLARLEAAGLHVDAIDQWIEIVNRDPDDRDLVLTAVGYARRHKQLDRLTNYYVNTAKASPKDIKWPLVLSWVHEAVGKPADAAREYGKALAIRPDRIDLLDKQADALVAAGDFAAAEKALERGFKLSDENVSWLLRLARARARLGKKDLLEKTVDDYVARALWTGISRYQAAAEILSDAGLDEPAWRMLRRGLDEALAKPYEIPIYRGYATALLTASMHAGKLGEGAQALAQAEKTLAAAMAADDVDGWTDDGSHAAVSQALTDDLLDLVARRALDADAKALLPMIVDAIRGAEDYRAEQVASRAAEIGFEELALEVIAARRASAKPGWQRERWDAELIQYYAVGQGDRELLDLFAKDKSLRTVAFLPAASDAARRLGDVKAERELLAAYWDALDDDPQRITPYSVAQLDGHVARWLELLREAGDKQALRRAAQRGNVGAGQVIDYLFAIGEPAIALEGIEAVARQFDRKPVWTNERSALALVAYGDTSERTHSLFQRALGRRTAGEHEKGALPNTEAHYGSHWYRLASAYGDYLMGAPTPGVRPEDYAFARVEDRPLDAGSHDAVGRAWLARKQWDRAPRHFELATTLGADSASAWDGLALALLGGGDKAAALAAWDRIRTKTSDRAGDRTEVEYARALFKAGLVAEARAALEQRLALRWADLDADGGGRIIDALIEVGAPLDKLLRAQLAKSGKPWVYDKVFGLTYEYREYDRDYDYGGDDYGGDYGYGYNERTMSPILDVDALEPYYREAVALARAGVSGNLQTWQQAFATFLLSKDRFALAAKIVDEAVADWRAQGEPEPIWIALARAEAQVGLGGDPTAALAKRLAEASSWELSRAVAMLERREKPKLAARLTLAYLDATAGGYPTGDQAIAIARARLVLGEIDAATTALEAMIAARPEEIGGYLAAATVLEQAGQPAKARRFRERLASLAPRDAANRLGLAGDALATGDPGTAIEVATTLFGDRRADRSTREQAAALVAKALAAKPDLARKTAETLAARAQATPFDGATQVALAHARRAAGDGSGADQVLRRAIADGLAPRAALLALGEARLAAGDRSGGEPLLERALFLGRGDAAARRPLFRLRRAAERHAGAVGALEDALLAMYRQAGPTLSGKDSRARALDAGAREWKPVPDAAALAADAADSAERARDWLAAAYFRGLAARLSGEAEGRAQLEKGTANLQKALVAHRRLTRRYVELGEEVGR